MLDGVPVSPYIFLNPDGSQLRFDLNVVVEAPTGVVYALQCAGQFHEIREVEGFLIPVGGSSPPADPADDGPWPNRGAAPLVEFFRRTFDLEPPTAARPG